MVVGVFIVVLDRRQPQQNRFILHNEVDRLLYQPFQFPHIGILLSLDLGDHLFDRPDGFEEYLLGHFLVILFLKRGALFL